MIQDVIRDLITKAQPFDFTDSKIKMIEEWVKLLYDEKIPNRHFLGSNLKMVLNNVYHNNELCGKYPEILSFFGQRENMGKIPLIDSIRDDEFYLVLPYVIPKEISEAFQGEKGFIVNSVDREILEVQDAISEYYLREVLHIDNNAQLNTSWISKD